MKNLTKIANQSFGLPGNGGPTVQLDNFGGQPLENALDLSNTPDPNNTFEP